MERVDWVVIADMEDHERRLVMDELASSEARVLELVRGLSEEQWSFRETPERWSIAENIEHCVVFEGFIRGVIAKVLSEAAEPKKKAMAAEKAKYGGRDIKDEV